MANAVPVHPTKESKETPKKKEPVKPESAPKDVESHIPAQPGNHYKLPDGTVVRDN